MRSETWEIFSILRVEKDKDEMEDDKVAGLKMCKVAAEGIGESNEG